MHRRIHLASLLLLPLTLAVGCGDSGTETTASSTDTDTDTDTDATSDNTTTPTTSTTDDMTTMGPSTSDPTDTDPSVTDPTDTDPSVTDPTDTDPTDTDPTDTDPTDTDPTDTDPTTDTDTTEPDPICGNGEVEGDEECDDGNTDNTDDCTELCAAPSCEDGLVSGLETDVDCGGGSCDPCGGGASCLVSDDCFSLICDEDLVCTEASCFDFIQNGDETDIDCGGSCGDCPIPALVINEIDYDQEGTDMAEFVEIFNGTDMDVPLADLILVYVNGANNQIYLTLDLVNAGDTLPAGGYLVAGNAGVMAAPDALILNTANNSFQNGPDGVALIDTLNGVLIDSVAYEGDLLGVNLPTVGPSDLETAAVEDVNGGDLSLSRLINGKDTNMPTDWFQTQPTPGAENLIP